MAEERRTGSWSALREIKTVYPAWSDMLDTLVEHGVIDPIPDGIRLHEALAIPVLGVFVHYALTLGMGELHPVEVHDLLKITLDRLAERTCNLDQNWTTTSPPEE